MRAFLTGGRGFIGGILARKLRERGDDVVAAVRDPSTAGPLTRLGCRVVQNDLRDVDALTSAMQGCDAVLHVAGAYRVGIPAAQRAEMRQANVGSTERVLDAAAAAGVTRSVYVSTINTFGNTRGRIVDETFRRDPAEGFLSWYDETKFRAHEAAEERIARGDRLVIVQPGGVYGPGDHSGIGDQLQRAYRGRLRFRAFPRLGMNLVHVDDVADGIILAHDRGQIGRSYVLGGEITRLGSAIDLAASLGGRRPPRLAIPVAMLRLTAPLAPVVGRFVGLPANMREIVAASAGVTYWATDARARAELGYAPASLEAGLRRTFLGV